MRTNWYRWALISQIALFAYYQVIEWVSLFPWNDIRGGNGQETLDLVVAGVMVGLIAVTAFRLRWATALAALLYGYWLWLQIDSWWVPYVRGASPQWRRVYQANFGATIKFLPSANEHLAPDACHVVLQILISCALATTLLAAFRLRRREL
jgi:hypothetical protein